MPMLKVFPAREERRDVKSFRSHMRLATWVCSTTLLALAFGHDVQAQQQNTTNTVTTSQVAGVFVDADGVLRTKLYGDRGGQLSRQRVDAARAKLPADIAKATKLRKISLTRLEREVAKLLAEGREPTEEMRNLAGLTKVQFVFLYPESGDLVIAGPAEGWAQDLSGRTLGIESGRPVVQLEDLAVALRAFPPDLPGTEVISCSIDPTKQGLANLQEFLNSLGPRGTPDNAAYITSGMQKSLGLQTVTLKGVSSRTHFAKVLVEADYRMKLIGIGMERPPIKLASYVDLANPASVSQNAMQRWYFVPNYECVRVTDDDLGMELVGEGVKLVGSDEVVANDGSRAKTAKMDAGGQKFVQQFTQKYPELASQVPVFGQLRNLIDLSIAAAFIQQHDYYGRISWKMEIFGNEEAYKVETATSPERVETAVTAVRKGNRLVMPIGGGVRIEAKKALLSESLLPDEGGDLAGQRGGVVLDQLAEGQWWWD